MANLWLTYAWADNQDCDVDFIAQELVRAGVNVKLDRWNVTAGKRLWEQIATFITDPTESDAWAIFATQNSLASQPCREELAYALDRALNQRGEAFPVIALFPASPDQNLLPAVIRIRLYVSLADPDWKARTVAAVEGRGAKLSPAEVMPFFITQHICPQPFSALFEVRPRAGSWYPFVAAVPIAEKDRAGMVIRSGPRGVVPAIAGAFIPGEKGFSEDEQWYYELGHEEATPTRSFYMFFRELPSAFAFGHMDTERRMHLFNPTL